MEDRYRIEPAPGGVWVAVRPGVLSPRDAADFARRLLAVVTPLLSAEQGCELAAAAITGGLRLPAGPTPPPVPPPSESAPSTLPLQLPTRLSRPPVPATTPGLPGDRARRVSRWVLVPARRRSMSATTI